MSDWDPELYLRFEAERTRPARELLARIDRPDAQRVSDLGCGPGNSTELLSQSWPQAQVTGVDTSLAMLQKAQKRLPHCSFVQSDISHWQPDEAQDVIYANAALQWVLDHETLLPHLVSQLADNGILAIQMPDNLNQPSHALMRKVASEGPWTHLNAEAESVRKKLLTTEEYYDLLALQGCEVDIWRTTYYHVMPSASAIIEWLSSTGLRPFLDKLDEEQQPEFLRRYLNELEKVYTPRADGKVLLAFPRLFIVARNVENGAI